MAFAQLGIAQKKRYYPKNKLQLADTGIKADTILELFASENYKSVLQLSTNYLSKNNADTNLIIKTGLSYLFTGNAKLGFLSIDTLLVRQEYLLPFYCTELPFAYRMAKTSKVLKEIVQHAIQLNDTSIYTYFVKSLYFKNIDSTSLALKNAKMVFDKINSSNQATTFGYLLPTLLSYYNFKDSALNAASALHAKFPENENVLVKLHELQLKYNMEQAAKYSLQKLIMLDTANADYANALIELYLAQDSNDVACAFIKSINYNFEFDDKVLLANCNTEITNVNLQQFKNYTFNVNEKGKFFTLTTSIKSAGENNLNINFYLNNDTNTQKNYFVPVQNFDTSRVINKFFYKGNNNDSATSIAWRISNKVYHEIVENKTTTLNLGEGFGTFDLIENDKNAPDENAFVDRVVLNNSNKKLLNTLHILNADTNEQLWILHNDDNPIIIKLDAGISYKLIKIDK
jgi:hypothetical protein